ncbi:ATPase, T2SS/T4P/T4SS family [Ihubacter sp. rT4E-8]|uniref:ATPase, T2SS/T4P/T4SS family n=1 Tax=Ihubacter sp. rT4E-8 TaxID=3242369 RepID=UPI003CF9DA69
MEAEKEFCLEAYMSKALKQEEHPGSEMDRFQRVCRIVASEFDKEWNETDDAAKNRKLEKEKKAIMGAEEEMTYYKERIREILLERKLSEEWHPPWYPNLFEGIFAELYGLAGLAPWAYDMDEKYQFSSSAKLIGDRLYCLIDGKSQLQPQRIDKRRREQLKRTLLLATPYERLEYGFHEVYLHNGIRITIYSGDRTKEDQDIMVFRKYIFQNLTFQHLAKKGTIPVEAIPLFLKMIDIGFNVLFTGQVRSGKTTFLQIWQRYEDSTLEGLAIATDPETPWHKIMPEAPIMQLVADGEKLSSITKSLLRGDNDYILLEEMRDAAAFRLALDITSTGTVRSKATVHDQDGINVPYKMASKIREVYGGDSKALIAQVYKNFDYAIELTQMPEDKSRKIMKGIVEYSYDSSLDQVMARRVCVYDFAAGKWLWNEEGGGCKCKKYPEQRDKILEMSTMLMALSQNGKLETDRVVYPSYYNAGCGKG